MSSGIPSVWHTVTDRVCRVYFRNISWCISSAWSNSFTYKYFLNINSILILWPMLVFMLSYQYKLILPTVHFHRKQGIFIYLRCDGHEHLIKTTFKSDFCIVYQDMIHTCILTYLHTYIHTCMYTCIHAYIHTYIQSIHRCSHTSIHTYIHTNTNILNKIFPMVKYNNTIYLLLYV